MADFKIVHDGKQHRAQFEFTYDELDGIAHAFRVLNPKDGAIDEMEEAMKAIEVARLEDD